MEIGVKFRQLYPKRALNQLIQKKTPKFQKLALIDFFKKLKFSWYILVQMPHAVKWMQNS